MSPKTYKHAVSVSSQVFFCSAPIRLDAYDGCQFGCIYCFSRRRTRLWAAQGVHEASVSAFAERMRRVQSGALASALDEFLEARVPIQLGGLHDPFTPREESRRVTYRLLQILTHYEYPTVISTKGNLVSYDEYIQLLQRMNVFVRFSAAGISEALRSKIDRRCDTFHETLGKIENLSARGIPTGLRIQPVIPGFEDHALRMTREAASAGVGHVSFEYLKLPVESIASEIATLSDILGFNVVVHMRERGTRMVGRDTTLVQEAKRCFVKEARTLCREVGVRFGAGDTEFIPWSDGDGCCAGSGFFLANARPFRANFVGAIKHALETQTREVRFDAIEKCWSPRHAVSTYLDSKSRMRDTSGQFSDCLSLMAQRWNGTRGPYSPTFFEGVRWHGEYDSAGFKIYQANELASSLAEHTSDK